MRIDTSRTETLEIYVSSDRSKRECALLMDFPKQLIEALHLEPHDTLHDLHQYLVVPLESLNTLLVTQGISGNVSSPSDDNDDSVPDHGDNQQTFSDSETHFNENDASFAHSNGRHNAAATGSNTPAPSTSSATESRSPSAPLPDQFSHTLGFGTPTPQTQHHSTFNSSVRPSSLRTPTEPSGAPSAATGIYNTNNRSRNTDRLRHFAQNTDTTGNARLQQRGSPSAPRTEPFDMSEIFSALDDDTPRASVVAPEHGRRVPMQHYRVIPERNENERARDFEVGFLGEHFVGK